jgi:hypothetical protein
MGALTSDRNTPRSAGDDKVMGVAAAKKIFAGAIVLMTTAGFATPGATGVNLIGAGIAQQQVDNTAGANGDVTVRVREGIFRVGNSAAGDAITVADRGRICYAVDDQTVAKTSGSNTRSVAGIIIDVDDLGVYVLFSPASLAAYQANRRVFVPVRVTTLVGANVYRQISIHAGRVVKIWSVIEGVLTTGDATLTGAINGAAITTGVIIITQAGSAAGDKDSCNPTALNIVAPGDELSLTVGGTNATASAANAIFEIERD